mgnify:CR=1 FL=1|tara:strand:+ start:656 stop:814 length:159 start_codon:yes stop_codon:yes gene_type:complete
MADNKPKAAGNPTKKPFGCDAGSVANQYKWSNAKKAGNTNNPKKSPTPNGGK